MIKTALRLVRVLRYIRRRIVETESRGMDAGAFRKVSHEIVLIVSDVLMGKTTPESVLPLLDALDKLIPRDRMNDRADAGGKGGSGGKGKWVTINGTHVQINGSGQVTKGPSNLKGRTVPQATPQTAPQASQPKSGGNVSSSGNSKQGGNTGKAKAHQSQNPKAGGNAGANPVASGEANKTTTPKFKKPQAKFERVNSTITTTKNISIKFHTGYAKLPSGSKITGVEDFAGPGCKKPLAVADKLAQMYGGDSNEWVHSLGYSTVTIGSQSFYSELHWFENPKIGQTGMKVKRTLKKDVDKP